jgi:hypothetical protein
MAGKTSKRIESKGNRIVSVGEGLCDEVRSRRGDEALEGHGKSGVKNDRLVGGAGL